MHSYEYLMNEVEEKLVNVQKALFICETEKVHLNENLTIIKKAVDESFKRHIGTLQCRAKWLVCHADSIFHLKEGSLSQQIAELELITTELKSCLDAFDCSLNKREEIKMMAKNILQCASSVSLQSCESGSMSFTANDEKMEETIIGFGDIDAFDHSTEYDLLSDEGIFVVGSVGEQQTSIEMEVKSIEMYHLTAQSAKSEKEDFERVEIELQPVVSSYANYQGPSSDPSYEEVEEEESERDRSETVVWLHGANQVVPGESSEYNLSDDIESEEKLGEGSNCADHKVPLWLTTCDQSNPWIRHTRPNGIPPKPMQDVGDAGSSYSFLFSKEDDNRLKSQKRKSTPSMPRNEKEESANISHMSNIALSANSKFLRIDIEDRNSSVYSLDSALNSMFLLERQPTTDYQRDFSPTNPTTNVEHLNGIFQTPSSEFLRGSSINRSNSVFTSEPDVLVRGGSDAHSEMSVDMDRLSIARVDQVLCRPHSEFLMSHDISKDAQVSTKTYIKPTNAVNHMRMLEKQPDQVFLRYGDKRKTFDPAMCEWLRGTSVDRCAQCFEFKECEINSTFDSRWIKTATDW